MRAQRIVIVGAGFAGVGAALGAAAETHRHHAGAQLQLTLVSPDDAHLIRVRMYESDLAGTRLPLAEILGPVEVEHVRATVEQIDAGRRRLILAGDAGPQTLDYDELVLCPGSRRTLRLQGQHNHGIDNWQESSALHRALDELSGRSRCRPRVVIVGAGFTGLELAAELSVRADVELVDGAPTIAPDFGPGARAIIVEQLQALGVRLNPGRRAAMLAEGGGVELDGDRVLEAELAVWTTGLRASELGAQLGIPVDELGRVPVSEHLGTELAGVWVAGDSARVLVDGRHLAMMSCQHAMPQGRVAGANAVRALIGEQPESYHQPAYRTCLDLGPAGALLTDGFERDDVVATGEDAKRVKQAINRRVIVPPVGAGPEPLLALGRSRPPAAAGAEQAA